VHPTPTQAIGTSTRSALPWTQSASRFKAHLSHFIKLFLRDAFEKYQAVRAGREIEVAQCWRPAPARATEP
ncbi:MAG: hypothetical protein M3495_21365, partial [Pseudomonadota bacterium]|nr:hypothetical protein [Pseudomonadota bacterium]